MQAQRPLDPWTAWFSVVSCFVRSLGLLAMGRVHLSRDRQGLQVQFTDGTSARVYRETRLGSGLARHPCALVVVFRLRAVRGRGHALFRAESLLNTPLFVGFPGFASKLWLTADERGRYRGVYEWDGREQAVHYARSLWRVLALVSVPGSIGYMVLPDLRREDLLSTSPTLGAASADDEPSWALVKQKS